MDSIIIIIIIIIITYKINSLFQSEIQCDLFCLCIIIHLT